MLAAVKVVKCMVVVLGSKKWWMWSGWLLMVLVDEKSGLNWFDGSYLLAGLAWPSYTFSWSSAPAILERLDSSCQ